ncbi:hypothetical protein FPV67DRAFT_1585943 [Lyophyllum atratum]|nr:hypothetical protein FPV67DRAFT_1585943 [Lyophyllum atratum]
MSHLPQEIVNSIIEELAKDDWDRAWLKACSLVSLSFCSAAQKHIFRQIEINLSLAAEAYVKRLHEILTSSPHIVSYVESLILQVDPNSPNISSIPSTLRQLPRLHRLRVVLGVIIFPDGQWTWDWASLPDELRRGILSLLQIPTLRELSLRQIRGFPINGLRHCPQLKSLRLRALSNSPVEWSTIPIPAPSSPSTQLRPGYLDSLKVCDRGTSKHILNALRDPSSSLSLSKLRSYHDSILEYQSHAALSHSQEILKMCASSLELLYFELQSMHMSIIPSLDLHDLSNLKHLRLSAASMDQLLSICCTLNSIPATNSLAEVIVSIIRDTEYASLLPTRGEWHQIDDLLTREGMVHLRRVVICLFDCAMGDRSVIAFFTESMPKLRSCGYLSLDFGDGEFPLE